MSDLPDYCRPVCFPENEQYLIGAILAGGRDAYFTAREHVQADDFHEPPCLALFKVIGSMADDGAGIDEVTVWGRVRGGPVESILPGGAPYIADLRNMVLGGHQAALYAPLVAEMGHRRRMQQAALQAAQELANTRTPGKEAIQRAEGLASDMLRGERSLEVHEPGFFISRIVARIDRVTNPNDAKRIKTPWVGLNNFVARMEPGQMIVVAAATGGGKSSFGTNMLNQLCVEEGRPCLLATLEVPGDRAIQNMACALSGVNGKKVDAGTASDLELSDFQKHLARVKGAPLHIIDTPDITGPALRGIIGRMAIRSKIEFVVVDYLQLLKPDVEGKNVTREREVGRASSAMKNAAREAGVPIVVLAQFSRAYRTRSKDAEPMPSDLRDSGQIEQDADIVVLMHTPEAEEDKEVRQVQWRVAKNRTGPVGKFNVFFNAPFTRFENPTSETLAITHGFAQNGSAPKPQKQGRF